MTYRGGSYAILLAFRDAAEGLDAELHKVCFTRREERKHEFALNTCVSSAQDELCEAAQRYCKDPMKPHFLSGVVGGWKSIKTLVDHGLVKEDKHGLGRVRRVMSAPSLRAVRSSRTRSQTHGSRTRTA